MKKIAYLFACKASIEINKTIVESQKDFFSTTKKFRQNALRDLGSLPLIH